MKFFRFLASKTFWANVVLVALVCVGLFFALNWWLGRFTRHGDTIKVPNLLRLDYAEADQILKKNELKGVILDTAEFTTEFPRGSIIAQYPSRGSEVKTGREIRLTVNPMKARKIEMPQLIEKTKRRAIYDLESKGFEVGELTYVPYIGKDVVVDMKVDGLSVKEKTKWDKGTVVELVLGQGLGRQRIPMPYLRFLSLEEAKLLLQEKSLNLGSVMYENMDGDTASAVVLRQYPPPSREKSVNVGSEVDLWLTTDYTIIPNDSLDFLVPDSLDNYLNDTSLQDW